MTTALRGNHSGLIAFVLLGLAGVSPTCVRAASFQGLGDLPGGYVYSAAYGVSADGQVVVGISYSTGSGSQPEALRWTQAGGIVGLGFFPSTIPSSGAACASADGAVVAGSSLMNNDHMEAFRWTQSTGLVGLGDLPGGIVQSFPFGISADGGVVVGFSASANGREAFRWTQAGGMVGLGDLPQGDFYSEAYGVSADGSVIVGYSRSGSGPEAFRWTQAGGMVGLGAPLQDQFESRASAVSADGTVVVGHAFYGLFQPFRWTQAGGMVKLGDLPNGVLTTQVPTVSVSADGAVVVGTGYPSDPFIWDASSGIRNLRDVLVNQYGLDLTGWTLTSATGISADGLTIVGSGVHAGFGNSEGWIARLAVSGVPTPTATPTAAAPSATPTSTASQMPTSMPTDTPTPTATPPPHDSVVLPPKPKTYIIPAGQASIAKKLRVTVVNADILPVPEPGGHAIRLDVTTADCPPGIVGTPDFGSSALGPSNVAMVPAGASQTALVPLTITSAAFTSFNRKAATRCTLTLAASAGDSIDPTPENAVATVEINVIDRNDPEGTVRHETLIKSVAPVRITLHDNTVTKTAKTKPVVISADILPAPETSFDTITVVASDGDCPSGTVGVADYNPLLGGAQNFALLKGGKSQAGSLPLTINAAAFFSPNQKSPARCSAVLTAIGPGGDSDATNSVTSLVIDVIDRNDF